MRKRWFRSAGGWCSSAPSSAPIATWCSTASCISISNPTIHSRRRITCKGSFPFRQFGFLGPDVLGVQAAGIAYAGPPGSGAVDPLTEDLTDKIRRVPGVEMAINRYIETGTMEFNGHSDIVFAWNIPEGKDRSIAEEM